MLKLIVCCRISEAMPFSVCSQRNHDGSYLNISTIWSPGQSLLMFVPGDQQIEVWDYLRDDATTALMSSLLIFKMFPGQKTCVICTVRFACNFYYCIDNKEYFEGVMSTAKNSLMQHM